MIRIGDYAIDAGELCYTVGKSTTFTDKSGNQQIRIQQPRYYTGLPQAITAVLQAMQKECVADGDMDLESALRRLQVLTVEFTRAVREAVPEVEITMRGART